MVFSQRFKRGLSLFVNYEEGKKKTAFEFRGKTYERNGMAMGYRNSPMIMQRIMERIFGDMTRKCLMVYLDDIIVFGNNVH